MNLQYVIYVSTISKFFNLIFGCRMTFAMHGWHYRTGAFSNFELFIFWRTILMKNMVIYSFIINQDERMTTRTRYLQDTCQHFLFATRRDIYYLEYRNCSGGCVIISCTHTTVCPAISQRRLCMVKYVVNILFWVSYVKRLTEFDFLLV